MFSFRRRNNYKQSQSLNPLDETLNRFPWAKWIVGVVLLVTIAFLFPTGHSIQFADMQEGSVSTRRVVAPFNFEILKTKDEYQLDKDLAQRQVQFVFKKQNNVEIEIQNKINQFFEDLFAYRKIIFNDQGLIFTYTDSILNKYSLSIESRFINELVNPFDSITKNDLKRFQADIQKIVRDLMSLGILSIEKDQIVHPDRRVLIADGNSEYSSSVSEYYSILEVWGEATKILETKYPVGSLFRHVGYSLIVTWVRPNLIFDETLHDERVKDAIAKVPLSSGFVYENERIVGPNERITPEIRKKLVSLSAKMAEKGMQESGIKRFLPFVGKLAFVACLLFVFAAFINLEKPSILINFRTVLLISIFLLLIALITFLVHRLDGSKYLIPSALGGMLLAALFNPKIGYVGNAVIAVLVGALWGNEFTLATVSFFTGSVGVLTIHRIRDRSQLIKVIFYLAGAYILTITVMGFLGFVAFNEILKEWPFGAVNGLLTPIIIFGLLPLIESIFQITTDFTLLELSNLNHPLLKKLSMQASGTYHHCILVGNLAEAAAQAVGANSLLARVGSYYHDIGKIEKSEYFVENQIGGENPHEKLVPRMSALILMNHVKRGLELAEQYRLPQSIRDIITQHQGTTVMPFFYRKALDKAGQDGVNEDDYRYSGPKPQTKEAAIVMLADVIEAATRSLKAPTHSRLKGLVNDLIEERFQEGELNEAPITLRDLERIKESFLVILGGMFHTRVEYPDKDDTKMQTSKENQESDKKDKNED